MRLAELVDRTKYLKEHIRDLKGFIRVLVSKRETNQDELNKLRRRLDSLIDKRQSYLIKIDRANNQIDIRIGDNTIKLSDALKLRNTLKEKIDGINDIVEYSFGNIDMVTFMQAKDDLFEELIIINNAIISADWSAEID